MLTGLEKFGLTRTSFRMLGGRPTMAYAYLRTFDVTLALRRIPVSHRLRYAIERADGWIRALRRNNPRLSVQVHGRKPSVESIRRWSQLPSTLIVRGAARDVLRLDQAAGVSSVNVTKIAGFTHRNPTGQRLKWYCVRALVIIRVEGVRGGMQTVEDRLVLVRALSFADAQKRLRRQWRDYATPYLNSDGRMVSWSFDRVTDVYDVGEAEIDPMGTEVYSKLGTRRMRARYVWIPKPR